MTLVGRTGRLLRLCTKVNRDAEKKVLRQSLVTFLVLMTINHNYLLVFCTFVFSYFQNLVRFVKTGMQKDL